METKKEGSDILSRIRLKAKGAKLCIKLFSVYFICFLTIESYI